MSTGSDASPTGVGPTRLRRLHPLSPVFQSWKLAGAAVAASFGLFRDEFDRIVWLWDALHGEASLSVLGRAALIIVAAGAVSALVAWLSWRATGFAVVTERPGDASLLYHRGLVVRRRSQVRLKRVQSIDVNQPLIPRLFGLAEVRLDMAAGDDASVRLAYLGADQAWELRSELLVHTSAAAPDASEADSPASAEQDSVVAAVALDRLVKASLLEGLGIWVGAVAYFVGVLVLWVVVGTEAFVAGLAGIVPVTIALAVYLRNRVLHILRQANFVLMRTRTGLRISAGLTSTINRTIDLDRVQGLRLEEPFLWRRLGWARVTVDVAGAAGKGDDDSDRTSLMPVTDRATALALIREVAGPDLANIEVSAPGRGSRVLDPWSHRFLGVALLASGAVSRSGRLRRTHAFVPYARIQSVTASQGWLQRRCRVATVWLDLPTGGHRWRGQHRDIGDAAALVAELSGRARQSRQSPRVSPPVAT